MGTTFEKLPRTVFPLLYQAMNTYREEAADGEVVSGRRLRDRGVVSGEEELRLLAVLALGYKDNESLHDVEQPGEDANLGLRLHHHRIPAFLSLLFLLHLRRHSLSLCCLVFLLSCVSACSVT